MQRCGRLVDPVVLRLEVLVLAVVQLRVLGQVLGHQEEALLHVVDLQHEHVRWVEGRECHGTGRRIASRGGKGAVLVDVFAGTCSSACL